MFTHSEFFEKHRWLVRYLLILLFALCGFIPINAQWGANGLFLAPQVAHAAGTINGNVFRDYNNNGLDAGVSEPGIAGITVTLYDFDGLSCVTTTDGSGNYSFNSATCGVGAGPYRLEFTHLLTGPLAFLQPSAMGGSSVQFVPEGGGTRDVGFFNPSDYCQANPQLAVPCYLSGDGVGRSERGFVSFNYNDSGIPAANPGPKPGSAGVGPSAITGADASEVGSVWGVAHQRGSNFVFTSAFLKRQVGFAHGPSFLYLLNYNGSPTNVPITHMSLQGILPDNGGAAIDLGSVCRRDARDGDPNPTCDPQSTGLASDYMLPNEPVSPSVDLDAYGKVGTISYGDIELTEDGDTLWLVNLYQRALISMDVSAVNTANFTGSVGAINQYLLDTLPNTPTCTAGVFRPFALKFHDGVGYLGGVCTGETTPPLNLNQARPTTNVAAYVLIFDPNNPTAGFTVVLTVPLEFNREDIWFHPNPPGPLETVPADWRPWALNWASTFNYANSTRHFDYAQPILSGLEFADDGSLLLGFSDRFGQQIGEANYPPISGATANDTRLIATGGDLLHACRSGAVFVIEGSGPTCPVNENAGNVLTVLPGELNDGPNENGEYFYQEYMATNQFIPQYEGHLETAQGSMAWLPGRGEILTVSLDPFRLITGGMRRYNSITGVLNASYEIYVGMLNNTTTGPTIPTGLMGKAHGLGDVELLCILAPIEVGNYVWFDKNRNGIQDPHEPPLAGVQVQLIAPNGTDILATATTDSSGNYLFSSDPTRTADTTASRLYNIAGLTADTANFTVRILLSQGALAGYVPTITNSQTDATNSNILDIRDSDGASAGGFSQVTFATGPAGNNNHGLDFGFTQAPIIDVEKLTNGIDVGDSNSADVPELTPGDNVTWSYILSNPGTTTIHRNEITVVDSKIGNLLLAGVLQQGATFSDRGDNNDELDPGEIWILVITRTVLDLALLGVQPAPPPPLPSGDCGPIGSPPHQRALYTNIVTATIPGDSDVDNSYYCNPKPGIDIEKLTNGADADDPNGADVPQLPGGSHVTWSYVLQNNGPVSIGRALITVSDTVEGALMVNGVLQPPANLTNQGDGDELLEPAEIWIIQLTRVVRDLNDPGQTAGLTLADGCDPIDAPDNTRNAYRNIATVTIPGDSDSDPSHYCNTKEGIQIRKLTNGRDANDPDGIDVPVILPIAGVQNLTWTYIISNTGGAGIALNTINVSDDILGNLLVNGALQTLPTGYTGPTFGDNSQIGDGVLNPNESFTLLVTTSAPDLNHPTASSNFNLVAGCDPLADAVDSHQPTYRNLATVTIPGDSDSDPSHFCNPEPGIFVIKLTNGREVLDPNALTVPRVKPGDPITWTYLIRNITAPLRGHSDLTIPQGDLDVTDNDLGPLLINGVPQTGVTIVSKGDGDNNFEPGEEWILQFVGVAPNLDDPTARRLVNVLQGCEVSEDAVDSTHTTYVNVVTVTIPGDEESTPSYFCNPRFDLALIKTLAAGQALTVTPDSDVNFAITVTNQGGVDAFRVEVTDYLPAGFTLNDPDWTDNGDGTATLKTPIAHLPVLTSVVIAITLHIRPDIEAGEYVNFAEISDADDDSDPNNTPPTDIDSTPDNDPGGDPHGPTDNVVDNLDGDEDDEDPAFIIVVEDPTAEEPTDQPTQEGQLWLPAIVGE